jgi:hypothetical protein
MEMYALNSPTRLMHRQLLSSHWLSKKRPRKVMDWSSLNLAVCLRDLEFPRKKQNYFISNISVL